MLKLIRKVGESIQIGDDVTIKVMAIQGDKVRLSFDAPRHISIHRMETYKRELRRRAGVRESTVTAKSAGEGKSINK